MWIKRKIFLLSSAYLSWHTRLLLLLKAFIRSSAAGRGRSSPDAEKAPYARARRVTLIAKKPRVIARQILWLNQSGFLIILEAFKTRRRSYAFEHTVRLSKTLMSIRDWPKNPRVPADAQANLAKIGKKVRDIGLEYLSYTCSNFIIPNCSLLG